MGKEEGKRLKEPTFLNGLVEFKDFMVSSDMTNSPGAANF